MVTKTQGYKTAADLPDELRADLGALLLSLADNKRLLGMRYSEWLLGAPTLEAGIACSAMAQDEWGHGRILYAMLNDFGFEPGRLEHERDASEYHSIELLDDPPPTWQELVALNFLLDSAISVQCQAMRDSRYEPLHYKMKKLIDEERFHLEHGSGWTLRMAETEAGRQALSAVFGPAVAACLRWFGSPDGAVGVRLAEHGIVDGTPDDLRGRWLALVGPSMRDAGLEIVEADGAAGWAYSGELDWNGWDGERRRFGPGGPDQETLAGVRGDKNRALLMD